MLFDMMAYASLVYYYLVTHFNFGVLVALHQLLFLHVIS
jgi:hypothetical protein